MGFIPGQQELSWNSRSYPRRAEVIPDNGILRICNSPLRQIPDLELIPLLLDPITGKDEEGAAPAPLDHPKLPGAEGIYRIRVLSLLSGLSQILLGISPSPDGHSKGYAHASQDGFIPKFPRSRESTQGSLPLKGAFPKPRGFLPEFFHIIPGKTCPL